MNAYADRRKVQRHSSYDGECSAQDRETAGRSLCLVLASYPYHRHNLTTIAKSHTSRDWPHSSKVCITHVHPHQAPRHMFRSWATARMFDRTFFTTDFALLGLSLPNRRFQCTERLLFPDICTARALWDFFEGYMICMNFLHNGRPVSFCVTDPFSSLVYIHIVFVEDEHSAAYNHRMCERDLSLILWLVGHEEVCACAIQSYTCNVHSFSALIIIVVGEFEFFTDANITFNLFDSPTLYDDIWLRIMDSPQVLYA